MSKTKQQKQRQLRALAQRDTQEVANRALTTLLAWTNSTSLALLSIAPQHNLDERDYKKRAPELPSSTATPFPSLANH
jgi:hypothetical protein